MSRTLLVAALALALALPAVPATAQQDDEPGLTAPELTALGGVLYDPAADQVLWGRREDVGIPMASTTKIMTTLLALEAGGLDETVEVSREAAQAGGAGLGLRMGQRLPLRSLLAGLMLRSGNDAATAVAEHVAGTEEAFVARMNARARQLGLSDTHFVNASGLTDDREHRASPLDLARLTKAAMAHAEFARWAGAPRLTVPGLAPMENRNELVGRYPGATGVKTGYLSHAGFALVASAEREELTLYAVVLGSQDSFRDAARILDWGYARYRLARPAAAGAVAGRYRWAGADTPLTAVRELAAAVPRDAQVAYRLRVRPLMALPVTAGTPLGEAELVAGGEVVATTPLVAGHDVAAPPPRDAPAEAGAALQDGLRALARLHPGSAAA